MKKKIPITKEHLQIAHKHLRDQWRKISLYGLGAIGVTIIIVQMAYPWANLPLYATIDGQDVGNMSKDEATKKLDEKYKKTPIALYFGNSTKSYRTPLPEDIGLIVRSEPQVDAKTYSLWLRLVPTSLWWAHFATGSQPPEYKRDANKVSAYVKKELGESCDVKPQNATLKYKDKKLQVVPAIDGGTCKLTDVERLLGQAKPRLNQHTLRIPMNQRPAKVQNDAAKDFAKKLDEKTKNLSVVAGTSNVTVSREDFLSWLDFAVPDSGIVATVNIERSAEFFAKQLLPKVYAKPGTSHITTHDFTEVSRVNGAPGQTLDEQATIKSFNEWLSGASTQLTAHVRPVAPTPVFTRTYSPTDEGLSALITQFAQSHSGSFGVSFIELDGKGRRATYQDTKAFRTASTYKLFVAYGTLKRIESGQWRWTDHVTGGRDLSKCFDDMIVKSDNPCAETLLAKIGYKTLTNELKAIGLKSSSFMGSVPLTTAGDLTTFNGSLQSGQLLNPTSTNLLLSAMKRNIYRQGIPKGASGAVADKVGFLDAYLHDAAIVYSPSGTYVLSVMTEGSSWAAISELTKQIEALRSQ